MSGQPFVKVRQGLGIKPRTIYASELTDERYQCNVGERTRVATEVAIDSQARIDIPQHCYACVTIFELIRTGWRGIFIAVKVTFEPGVKRLNERRIVP
jgi:hypothetical protein